MKAKLPDAGLASHYLIERELTSRIIECFFTVYNTLGFGMLESVYRHALAVELSQHGLDVRQEVPIDVVYRGVEVGHFRLDVLVQDKVAVEVKATELLSPAASRQLLNYLRASHLDVGLLLHFGPEAKFRRLVSPRVLSRTREERIRQFPKDP
jgi:GxxExxY protein